MFLTCRASKERRAEHICKDDVEIGTFANVMYAVCLR